MDEYLENIKNDINKITSVKDSKIKQSLENNIKKLEDIIKCEHLKLQTKIIHLQEQIIKNSENYCQKLETLTTSNQNVKTYAQATIQHKSPVFPIIIKSNNNENIQEIITKNIKISKLGIGVTNMRKTNKNELIMKLKKEDDMVSIKNEIKKLNIDGIHVENLNKKRPCMIFKGIDENYDHKEFISDLILQNDDIKTLNEKEQNKIEHKGTIHIKKYNQKNLIIETTGEIRNLLLAKKRVNLGFYQIKVEDCNPLMQCYHCQKYGHTALRCLQINKKPKCFHCAGEHNIKECTKQHESPNCINCIEINLKLKTSSPTNHKSNSDQCKHRIKMLHFAKEKINYI